MQFLKMLIACHSGAKQPGITDTSMKVQNDKWDCKIQLVEVTSENHDSEEF